MKTSLAVLKLEYKEVKIIHLLVVLFFNMPLIIMAQPGTWFGSKQVLMFEEQKQEFSPTCMCYMSEYGSSPNHMKFQLKREGFKYDLCHAGYYLANVTTDEAVCKPCPDGTYNPYRNACPYCLICRTCAENEFETNICSRKSDRECQCDGLSCEPDIPTTANVSVFATPNQKEDIPTTSQPTTSPSIDTSKLDFSNKYVTVRSSTICPSCETETNWKKLFTVITIVLGSVICIFLVIIGLQWIQLRKPRRYQGVRTNSTENEQRSSPIQMRQSISDGGYQEVRTNSTENEQRSSSIQMRQSISDAISIDDETIENLVKQISNEYRKIGSFFGFTVAELDNIEKNNKSNFENAVRTMLTKAREKHGNKSYDVFIKALIDSDRVDLAEVLDADQKKKESLRFKD